MTSSQYDPREGQDDTINGDARETPLASQPVAWMDPQWTSGAVEVESAFLDFKPHESCGWVPVYTATPSPQPLTLSDEQIEAARIEVFKELGADLRPEVATIFARAVLAAAQEKKP